MNIRAGAVSLLLCLLPVSAVAFSVGPRDATEVAACTFGGFCTSAAGAPDDSCAYSSGSSQVVVPYKFGFQLPSSAVIDGIVAEVKMGDNSCPASVRLTKGGVPAPTSLPLDGPDTLICSATSYVTAGTPTELWGTAWTYSDINDNTGFAMQIANNGCTGTGVDSARVTVYFSIPSEQCGDGYTTGTEACDDGNFVSGDGCSPGCETEHVLDADAQKCVVTMNKAAATISKETAKVDAKCAQDVALGKEGDFVTCETAGLAKKVAGLEQKAQDKAAKVCASTPDYGFSNALSASTAPADHTTDLLRAMFGDPPAILDVSNIGSACQRAAIDAADRILQLKTTLFVSGKKSRLAGKTLPQVVSGYGLGEIAQSPVDPKDKTPTLEDTLFVQVDSICSSLAGNYTATFVEPCASATGTNELFQCVLQRAECERCRIANAVDALALECEAMGCPP